MKTASHRAEPFASSLRRLRDNNHERRWRRAQLASRLARTAHGDARRQLYALKHQIMNSLIESTHVKIWLSDLTLVEAGIGFGNHGRLHMPLTALSPMARLVVQQMVVNHVMMQQQVA